jgi:hypothetical protein
VAAGAPVSQTAMSVEVETATVEQQASEVKVESVVTNAPVGGAASEDDEHSREATAEVKALPIVETVKVNREQVQEVTMQKLYTHLASTDLSVFDSSIC